VALFNLQCVSGDSRKALKGIKGVVVEFKSQSYLNNKGHDFPALGNIPSHNFPFSAADMRANPRAPSSANERLLFFILTRCLGSTEKVGKP